MFKIIGADLKEYGPASVETVRRWIGEGRANAQTRAQAAGSSEWKPLAAFAEFADLLGAVPPPVPAMSATPPPAATPIPPIPGAGGPVAAPGEATSGSSGGGEGAPTGGVPSSTSSSSAAAGSSGSGTASSGASTWSSSAQTASFGPATASPGAATASPGAATANPGAAAAATVAGLPAVWSPKVDARQLADEACARNFSLDIEGCFGRGWSLITHHFWLLVGGWCVYALVAFALVSIPYLGAPLSLVFGGVLVGGINLLFLKTARGEPATVGDVFAGFSAALGTLILYSLVSSILTTIGWILCILPGIYLSIAWSLAPLLIMDQRLGFWDALEVSRRVVTQHFWGMLGLFCLLLLIFLAAVVLGFLSLCVGILVTVPVACALWNAATVQAYLQLFEKRETRPA